MIEWTSELETGVRVIDFQHRQLVDIINALEQALDANSAPTAIFELLERLAAYVDYHFAAEEGYMAQHGFSVEEVGLHAGQHAAFADEVSHTVSSALAKEGPDLRRFLAFLTTWLVRHVCGTDKAMVQRIRALSL